MNTKRFGPCPKCGKPTVLRRLLAGKLCWKCEVKLADKSPHLAGRGHKHTHRLARCKMPKCRKMFRLREDQDPRYTIYCHDCRAEIAKITTGVNWLQSLGIEVGPDDGDAP